MIKNLSFSSNIIHAKEEAIRQLYDTKSQEREVIDTLHKKIFEIWKLRFLVEIVFAEYCFYKNKKDYEEADKRRNFLHMTGMSIQELGKDEHLVYHLYDGGTDTVMKVPKTECDDMIAIHKHIYV